MKIIVVGARGDIGQAACQALGARHELIEVGRSYGAFRIDMTDRTSIEKMYADAGPVDAVVAAAGDVHFAPLEDQTEESILRGLHQKVMGQINLVLAGMNAIREGGSFTLTTGIVNRDPIRTGTAAATANGAIEGFVRSAAIELPRRLRVNAVSPGLLEASAPRYGAWFPGHIPVSSRRVGQAYVKCVERAITGLVVTVD